MMVALTVLLILLTKYMALFSGLAVFVCGVPMAVLSARNGFRVIIPSLVAVFLLSLLIEPNIIGSALTLLSSVIPGAVAGYCLGKRKPFFICLCATAVAVVVGYLFSFLMLELFFGGVAETFSNALAQTRAMVEAASKDLGAAISEEMGVDPKTFIDIFMEALGTVIRLYTPAVIIVISMFSGYIILRFSGFIINRTRLARVECIAFSEMRAPRSLATVAVIIYLVYIFGTKGSGLWAVCANLVFVLYTILGVCGLSFVDFKLKKRIKAAPLRFALYVAVFVFGSMLMGIISNILIIIGILDSGRNFRGIKSLDKSDSADTGGTV